MELTTLQKNIINSTASKIAVEACAASLKTSTLTEKVRVLLRQGIAPSSIAVITFTRLAAAELIDRLGEDYKNGLFVGTIHALAAKILISRGYGEEVNQIAEKEDFDQLFSLCSKFYLRNLYDWILVDECQDTGINELNFIFEMLAPPHYLVVFDRRQSIYQFKGARPDILISYLTDATFFPLNENFRNGYNILNFAKALIKPTGMTDNSVSMVKENGTVARVEFSFEYIKNQILENKDYGNWAILVRLNREVDETIRYLRNWSIPCETFRQGDLKRADLLSRLNNNKVKVLTIHSSKGLAFDNVVVFGVRFSSKEERNLCYVAATRARKKLIWMSKKNKNKMF